MSRRTNLARWLGELEDRCKRGFGIWPSWAGAGVWSGGESIREQLCAPFTLSLTNFPYELTRSDPELRTRVLKVTTMNLISLLLLSLLPLMAPVLSQSSRAARVGFWYNVLLNWPMFAVCFAVNAYWGPGVAKRAQSVMHPA